MTRIGHAPPAASCPAWCVTDHTGDLLVREHVTAERLIASFVTDPPLTVAVKQVTFMAPGPVDTDPVVRIGRDEITPGQARQLAARLIHAADLADALTTR